MRIFIYSKINENEPLFEKESVKMDIQTKNKNQCRIYR